MMEKNITLTGQTRPVVPSPAQVCKRVFDKLLGHVRRPALWLRGYYSQALGRQLTLRQTGLLLSAQASFALAFLPAEAPLLWRAACALWLWRALRACRREL